MTGADKASDPLTGTTIDRRYEVVGLLGQGGMGTVYKVRHVALDRLFAMKVLRQDLATDLGLAKRFLHEARATAAIQHPSVVAITDFGALSKPPCAPYFVMELLVGETLATHLRARGVLPAPAAAAIARKVAEALAAAHERGVVHRDLKPENVFLVGAAAGGAADEVRVVDFGAAKILGASKLTRPGVVFGTPHYMSPEQASGAPVDGRSDVYSLGVLLYELITGTRPFEADTYMGILTKHMFAVPVKPSERLTGVQLGSLEDVVLRALEKEPSARYASMHEFAGALHPAVTEDVAAPRPPPSSARPVGLAQMSTADRIHSSVTRHIVTEARRRRRLWALGSVGAASALGVIALAILLVRAAPNDTRQAPSTLASTAPRASPPAPPPPAATPESAVAAAPAASSAASNTLAVARAPSGLSGPSVARPRPPPSASSPPAAGAGAPPPPSKPVAGPATGDFPDPWTR